MGKLKEQAIVGKRKRYRRKNIKKKKKKRDNIRDEQVKR